jgi:putative nucleotidyltransferase with HDIG domain
LPPRETALALLHEYTQSDSLRKHALAVECAMRAYARRFAAEGHEDVDEEEWGLIGLLHDFDYEVHPAAPDHATKGAEILAARGYPEDFRRAILSHASYTGVSRDRLVEKALFAVDELCGFLVAVALVRPGRTLEGLEPSSVKKKLKDKAFARSVSRDDVREGPVALGVEFDAHLAFVIGSLRANEGALGLGSAGPPPAA